MAKSQNGWPVVGATACDNGTFEGVRLPNGVLKGDVATVARWQMKLYKATVEPLVAKTCWGWYAKKIEGTNVYSNHASATAWDINAPQHPMGVPTKNTMSSKEIAACREIVRKSNGVLRWGGDYTGRQDAMHWEIIASPAKVSAFVDSLKKPQGAPKMEKISGYLPVLKRGMTDPLPVVGNYVRKLQRLHAISADGVFGAGTEAEVRAFNRQYLDRNDGIADADHWARLLGLRATTKG